jgi:NTP pyrophosphatase (non-canonical NTP hydrolase)
MKLSEYQKKATATAIYGDGNKINYPILGLVGEAGELANKYKKILRDNDGLMTPEKLHDLQDELGDVLWYVAALANDLHITLDEVAERNINKLESRKARGVIGGSGDNR